MAMVRIPANPLGKLLRVDPIGNNSNNGNMVSQTIILLSVQTLRLKRFMLMVFRNPFRFSFDHETNLLVLADVGQNDIEEINLIQAGGNYGWGLKEGSFRFEPNGSEPGFVTDAQICWQFHRSCHSV